MAKTDKGTGTDNRRRIIRSAISLITAKGVEKTSLADIARKTGLSKGTIYYYFSSKNDLIFELTKIHMEKITQDLFSMMDRSRDVTLQMLLERLFQALLASDTRSRLHLFLIREAISGNESLRRRFQDTYHEWFSMIIDACEQMKKKAENKDLNARILVAVLDGMIIQTLFDVTPPDTKDIARQMAGMINPD